MMPERTAVEKEQMDVVFYIAGAFANTFLVKYHDCELCRTYLTEEDRNVPKGTNELFAKCKAYDNAKSDIGSLTIPSQFQYNLIQRCEAIFMQNFEKFRHMIRKIE